MKTYLKSHYFETTNIYLKKRAGNTVWITGLIIFTILIYINSANGQNCNNCPAGNTIFTKGNIPKECGSIPSYFGVETGMRWRDCNNVNPWQTVPKDYTISDDASEWNGNWDKTSHTADNTGLVLIDGPQASDGDKKIWTKTVNVQAGRVYKFEAFVSNIHINTTVNPDFFLQVDGVPVTIGNPSASNIVWGSATSWTQLCGLHTACVNGSVELSIVMKGKGPTNAGNDGAVDDVTFKPVSNPIADLNYVPVVCNEPIDFTINSFDPQNTYNLEFGDGSAATYITNQFSYTYLSPGSYDLKFSVTSPCGGTSTVIHKINIRGCCDCETCGNLVGNPNFSDQNCFSLYSTEMIQDQCPSAYKTMIPGEIGEKHSSSAVWSNWCAEDHTGQEESRILMVDGPVAGNGNKVAWKQTGPVNDGTGYIVTPGMKYCFSIFVVNLDNVDPHYPSFSLHLKADGVDYTIAEVINLSSNEGCCWQRVCGSWIAPENVTNVQELSIVINEGTAIGNDLGIDDISFGPSCSQEMLRQDGFIPRNNLENHNHKPNGTYGESKCISCNKDSENLEAMPIPVQSGEAITIKYTSSFNGKIDITISDMSGKIFISDNKHVQTGENVILKYATSNLAPGNYILKINNGKFQQAKQIIIQ